MYLLLVHDSAAMLRHGSYGRLSRLTLLTNGSRGYHLLHVPFVLFYLHLKTLLKPGVNVSSMDRTHSRIAFAAVSSSHRLPTTMATSMSHEGNDRVYESYWYVGAAYTSLPDVHRASTQREQCRIWRRELLLRENGIEE